MRPSTISWSIFLGLLLCWSCPVAGKKQPKIVVSITGKTVNLRCPESNLKWHVLKGKTYVQDQDQRNPLPLTGAKEVEGQYACIGSDVTFASVYLKVRVCDNCLELSLGLVAGIIVSDLLITLGVLLVVYYCRKNRVTRLGGGAARGGTQGRPRSQKTDSPPPVPNPDYEPIRKGQREVYAGLQPSRAF
ncbi:T-cell surface glycoprotein CD3 epsilon chain isoform X2 [Tiliqua scincoides]|uniref:T-cell surface glycoprotein CD3 epsilon chain isoform X2 n=1 Tax=Tiliqua scincoides TaxID=71010 RepID=UPI003462BC7B